jgi:hypothetical protein
MRDAGEYGCTCGSAGSAKSCCGSCSASSDRRRGLLLLDGAWIWEPDPRARRESPAVPRRHPPVGAGLRAAPASIGSGSRKFRVAYEVQIIFRRHGHRLAAPFSRCPRGMAGIVDQGWAFVANTNPDPPMDGFAPAVGSRNARSPELVARMNLPGRCPCVGRRLPKAPGIVLPAYRVPWRRSGHGAPGPSFSAAAVRTLTGRSGR